MRDLAQRVQTRRSHGRTFQSGFPPARHHESEDSGRDDRPPKETKMTTQVQERVEVLRDERDRAIRAATSVAVIGMLVGLSAFFVTLAPHV